MITIIFGAPGAGKSSLNTYFLKEQYEKFGPELLEKSKELIDRANEKRVHKLSYPNKPPIFSDFKVKFLVDYEEYFEPYFINGFYAGLPNEKLPTQFVPPGSKIFLSEVQRYYDSRKSQTMPNFISRAFEMHRHYSLDFWLDVQRPTLVDLNIRELCKCFIEVIKMENTLNSVGDVTRSLFRCHEFGCWRDVAQYLETGAKTYKDIVFVNEGNIFECFDSYNYFDEFLPGEEGDFKFLPFLSVAEVKKSPDAMFYGLSEPEAYRHEPKAAKSKKSGGVNDDQGVR